LIWIKTPGVFDAAEQAKGTVKEAAGKFKMRSAD